MSTVEGTADSILEIRDAEASTRALEELVAQFDEAIEFPFDPDVGRYLGDMSKKFFDSHKGFKQIPLSFAAKREQEFRGLHAALKVILRQRWNGEVEMEQRRAGLRRKIQQESGWVSSSENVLRESTRELLEALFCLQGNLPEMQPEIGEHIARLNRAFLSPDHIDFDHDLLEAIQHTLNLIGNCLEGAGPR